uniref:Bardet-Biedl syndrome 10 n=1 Tax=Leptobrachium leishanense TaxID=445787 RepID=A0A8C5M618_9ANUR
MLQLQEQQLRSHSSPPDIRALSSKRRSRSSMSGNAATGSNLLKQLSVRFFRPLLCAVIGSCSGFFGGANPDVFAGFGVHSPGFAVTKMQTCVKELDINKVRLVAESLESIVRGCFGPDGRHVLFIKSTGELLITKDGKKILECLLLDHPVARTIVKSALDHSGVTGDGVKSFIILLCSVLRELQAVAEKEDGLVSSENSLGQDGYRRQRHLLKRIGDRLATFQREVLEHIIRKSLAQHVLSVFSTSSKEIQLCRESLQSVLDTFFSGRIRYHNRGFISRLACDFFQKCLSCTAGAFEVVDLIDRFFPELHTDVQGLGVGNSRILPGVILHREFSLYCPAEGEHRALIVAEHIHQSLSASDVDISVCSNAHLQLCQSSLQQRTEKIIKRLHNHQIKLILSHVKQAEIVHYFAKQYGLSVVDCLLPEEIDLVRRISGVSPQTSLLPDDVLSGHLSDVFSVTSYQPIVLGTKKYVHLTLSSALGFHPHCVIMCGPVKGLTDQLISAFHSAFKMLKQLFQPADYRWEQTAVTPDHCIPNKSTPVLEIGNSCSHDQKKTACLASSLQGIHPVMDADQISTSETGLGDCKVNVNKMNPSDMCTKEERETPQYVPTSTSESIDQYPYTHNVPKYLFMSPVATVSQTHSVSLASAGLVLPGGGTFEILLHHHLGHFARTCMDRELTVTCNIIRDAVLCIPHCIYGLRKGNARLPAVYSQVIGQYQTKESKETALVGLESVCCKYQLLLSVLHCVSKLATIDFIIGTKRAPCNIRQDSDDEI